MEMGALALAPGIYPLFVFGYTWTHVFGSELEGGRHGPLDAQLTDRSYVRFNLATFNHKRTDGILTWSCLPKDPHRHPLFIGWYYTFG